MISHFLKELLQTRELVFLILWYSFTGFLLVIVLIAFVAAEQSNFSRGSESVAIILSFVAMLEGLLSLFWWKSSFRPEKLEQVLLRTSGRKGLSAQEERTVSDDYRRKVELLSASERRLLEVVDVFIVPFIVCLAMNESIAVIGFVISFISGSWVYVLPFALASLLLNTLMFPRLEPLIVRASDTPAYQDLAERKGG